MGGTRNRCATGRRGPPPADSDGLN